MGCRESYEEREEKTGEKENNRTTPAKKKHEKEISVEEDAYRKPHRKKK